jgi:hypothetical protein
MDFNILIMSSLINGIVALAVSALLSIVIVKKRKEMEKLLQIR